MDNLRDLPLAAPAEARMLLREVAEINPVEGPAQISRGDGKRRVVVVFGVVTSTMLTLPVLYLKFGTQPGARPDECAPEMAPAMPPGQPETV